MDIASRALCYALRNPPAGAKKAPCRDIANLVRKKDGTHPSVGAVHEAAAKFMVSPCTTGRPRGSRKTTKHEDAQLLKAFKALRPPGCGVDSRIVHSALPGKVRKKVSRRTVRRRLAEKGYRPEKKIQKSDPGPALTKKRIAFARRHQGKSPQTWQAQLQAVGDIKEFSYYPKALRGKFKKLRAPWTYMTKAEKHQPAFARPKRWFPRSVYKKVRKQKVFGLTASNGKVLALLVPKPWSAEKWAAKVTKRVAPFLKKAFPGRRTWQILLDGEKLLHAPAAKSAYKKAGITILAGWPKYSPDLNPQENVWAWAEPHLRKLEKNGDTFDTFKKRVLKAVCSYPSSRKLVASMAKRCALLLERKGAMLPK